ncbi:PucR family transcriptional regulator ligand-binding domain-containing protein [Nonomuraea sp. SMC257]|uniref:PucR family transcriptional regulator ligand-binding domain-containing protein n=1 Tax=Nonomuraea montanisoli TaxID=2741721 RepID=A0A7Y6I3H9_9ACTN|nr:PucR family transcriptional regulator [Nonomuraea montanisoli]NUW31032.1 PucR family transcriptional regulator ligand-binding domain-containing protein [Nonomuraea montanisoli]
MEPPVRPASTGTIIHGLSVGEVLGVSTLAQARLIAGRSGLGRIVQRLNVMEVPDVLAWVKPHELLLTTGYPLRNTPQSLGRLVADLDERGLSALAIKLGRYVDELPDEMVEQADRLGFPLIQLPDDVGFDDILNQVLTDILNRQAAVLARGEEAHRALVQVVLAGGGLDEVTEGVAGLLDVAVAAVDGAGRVLATAGPPGDVTVLRDSIASDGPAVPPQAVPPANAQAGGRDFVSVPVVAGGHHHGRIVAYSPSSAIRDTDVGILERAATVAALVVTRQEAVNAVESKYRADFLRDVLTGRAGTAERVAARARAFGWDLERPVTVLVAELDPDSDERTAQDRLVTSWTAATRRHDAHGAVAGFSHEVVAVLDARVDAARVAKDAASAFSDTPPATFSTGTSRPSPGVAALPEAYAQALKAARVGRQLHGPGAVAHFDQLGVYRLLSLVNDTAELHAFVRETLGPLATDDDAENADLRRTLQVLLETNLNVAETARRLHFHYNTLRYRIGKLERLLGNFTDDPHLRLNLTLALHVLRMRGI